jgi:dipicolinate synthase subunit A
VIRQLAAGKFSSYVVLSDQYCGEGDFLSGTKGKIAVLGGDLREKVLLAKLVEKDFTVMVAARSSEMTPNGISITTDIKQALRDADCLVLPMPGLREDNKIFAASGHRLYLTEEDLSLLPAGTPILVGVANDLLQKAVQKYKLELLPMAGENAIAIPNAMATAEGAIAIAISESPLLLAKSIGIIIGYGRVGRALALRLQALGMQLIVVDKDKEVLVQAQKNGFSVMQSKFCSQIADQVDFIFNTAPAPVIDKEMIEKLKENTLIVDIASFPGGTDFVAAKEIGIKALLAAGLPGKYAPYFMGEVLAKVYLPIIEEKVLHLSKRREDQ